MEHTSHSLIVCMQWVWSLIIVLTWSSLSQKWTSFTRGFIDGPITVATREGTKKEINKQNANIAAKLERLLCIHFANKDCPGWCDVFLNNSPKFQILIFQTFYASFSSAGQSLEVSLRVKVVHSETHEYTQSYTVCGAIWTYVTLWTITDIKGTLTLKAGSSLVMYR